MALRNIPVWAHLPNWGTSGILERLEWLTSVMQSRSAAEQRLSLRVAPRRSFEADFNPVGRERTLFDLGVSRNGGGEWYLPLWHDVTRVRETAQAGSSLIACDTLLREFKDGGAALLYRDAFNNRAVEVTSVLSDGLRISANLPESWPAGTRIYPLRTARLVDTQRQTRVTDRLFTASMRFEMTEVDDYPEIAPPTLYRDMPVLEVPPNETGDLSAEWSRLLDSLDNETGRPTVKDVLGFPLMLQQHSWVLRGKTQHAYHRALLYWLRGRQRALWIPTFSADLDMVQVSEAGQNAITVAACGFTAFGGPQIGRRDIRIEKRDGMALHARVTASALTSGGNERLVLDGVFPSRVAPADVRRISFMAQMRLDQDTVEITHETDTIGASTVVAAFRGTPESRSVEPLTPQPFPLPSMTAGICGEESWSWDAWQGLYGARSPLLSSPVLPAWDYTVAVGGTIETFAATYAGEATPDAEDEGFYVGYSPGFIGTPGISGPTRQIGTGNFAIRIYFTRTAGGVGHASVFDLRLLKGKDFTKQIGFAYSIASNFPDQVNREFILRRTGSTISMTFNGENVPIFHSLTPTEVLELDSVFVTRLAFDRTTTTAATALSAQINWAYGG